MLLVLRMIWSLPSKHLGTVFAFVVCFQRQKENPACAEEGYAPTFLVRKQTWYEWRQYLFAFDSIRNRYDYVPSSEKLFGNPILALTLMLISSNLNNPNPISFWILVGRRAAPQKWKIGTLPTSICKLCWKIQKPERVLIERQGRQAIVLEFNERYGVSIYSLVKTAASARNEQRRNYTDLPDKARAKRSPSSRRDNVQSTIDTRDILQLGLKLNLNWYSFDALLMRENPDGTALQRSPKRIKQTSNSPVSIARFRLDLLAHNLSL